MRELVDCIRYGFLYFNSINSIGREHKCLSRSYILNIMGDKLLPNFGAKFNTCEITKFRTSHCQNDVKVLKCMNDDVRALKGLCYGSPVHFV